MIGQLSGDDSCQKGENKMAAVSSVEEESVLDLPLGEVREVEPYRHEPRVRDSVVADNSTSVESATDNDEDGETNQW